MNERIQELAEEAGTHADNKRGSWVRDGMWLYEYNQKFAELIVNECLAIASHTHETKYGKMSCANDDETVRLIKERFGIE